MREYFKGVMMAYILFAGDHYYPYGGATDLQPGMFETAADAVASHDPHKLNYDGGWAHVFCLDTLKVVKWFDSGGWSDEKTT